MSNLGIQRSDLMVPLGLRGRYHGLELLTWKSFLQSLIICDKPWVAAMFSLRSLGPGRPTRLRLLLILEGRAKRRGWHKNRRQYG